MRVYYLSIMGEPGTYDPDVYRALEGGDHDGLWVARSFAHLPGVEIASVRVSHGDPPPAAEQADLCVVLPAAESRQFGGSLFEQALLLFLDGLVMEIIGQRGISHDEMAGRHANLE